MIYDSSSLQAFKDCPERYRLAYVLGLKKRTEGVENIDLNFGKAIHSGLEAHYTGKDEREAFTKEFGTIVAPDEKVKTLENGLLLIDAYIKHYEQEDKAFEVLEVEQPDKVVLTDGIEFIVKRDMVIKQQGCIYVLEHKTTKKAFSWDYWSRFEPNAQVSAQAYSCAKKYGECSGVIINAIKCGFRERAYKGEPAGFHCAFQRQIFNRNQAQLEDWKQKTEDWISRIEDKIECDCKYGWLKNEGQCVYCQFKEICTSLQDECVVEQLYEKAENPFAYLGEVEKKES